MHVITQNCCNDAACVAACPVGCIHPTPDEPGYDSAEMLYIDPEACIDCGACISMCPVDAIRTADDLGDEFARYAEINAFYAANRPQQPRPLLRIEPTRTAPKRVERLRVAIVGAGPAGLYAAEDLLTRHGVDVEVDVFDRLPTPLGLIRAGVAPDHQATKDAGQQFRWTEQRTGFRYHLGIEVGRDVSPAELAAHFHAVIYTHGASADRRLDIPGEHLPGSHSAAEFVAWYNGHPDFADRNFDLSGERAVIVGNGNVALDIARILLADPATLSRTDIADHALKLLRTSTIREVVVLGRRRPSDAAYTGPELEALFRLDDVDVVLEHDADPDSAPEQKAAALLKTRLAAELAARPISGASKRLVLRYLRSPVEVLGTDRATGLRIARNTLRAGTDGTVRAETTSDTEILETGLVLRAIGHRGISLPGLPFDDARGVVPNSAGRVLGSTGTPMYGTYTAGWIKRGPSGVIGTNKKCATETVDRLLDDARAGRLPAPDRDRRSLDDLLRLHRSHYIDRSGWAAIDQHERNTGAETGRPRVKVTSIPELQRLGVR
ncbi:4Fe-4S binding protein [Antrihabitans sp. YC2-6]|uniref:4Fe-4S binding protein n=1 Tax=Antrihabitans sp. YC2-6 TaxID=2799498 RepID=UPI0018F41F1C|nr:4Fe-4S binding protein [Antrihabitans sp. YC2-6]MBJ8348644.1 4Fe-4S binding protein [Antrihabitans sp. YC2-6]